MDYEHDYQKEINETSTETFTNQTPGLIYDAASEQRFAFVAKSGGDKYDTAHRFKALTDEKYLEYVGSLAIKGIDDEIETEISEAGVHLWNDLIEKVENIEFDEGVDWKSLISIEEKNEAVDMFLAVAVVEEEETKKGVRRLSSQLQQTIKTEAYFNGNPVQQTHVLTAKTPELTKKFDRLQRKRYKQETTGGLRRKPKVEYVPQDENLAKLYDEMAISSNGFKGDDIPIRFKTTVMYSVFASALEQKK